jgi:hypothetical protein
LGVGLFKPGLGVSGDEVEGDGRIEGMEEMDEVGGGGAAFVEFPIEEGREGVGGVVWVWGMLEYVGGRVDETLLHFAGEGVTIVVASGDEGVLWDGTGRGWLMLSKNPGGGSGSR